jgi:hypothetical protein
VFEQNGAMSEQTASTYTDGISSIKRIVQFRGLVLMQTEMFDNAGCLIFVIRLIRVSARKKTSQVPGKCSIVPLLYTETD